METWWHIYRREWCLIFASSADGDEGRREAEARRDSWLGLVGPDELRVDPWSEQDQDSWPWSLKAYLPVLRGVYVEQSMAAEAATRLGGDCAMVPKGSKEDRELASLGSANPG